MDNFFEILIYLILIISFLSSIFKKRTKEQPKPERQSTEEKQRGLDYQADSQNKQEPSIYSSKEVQYDILRELENLFKTDAERRQESSARPPARGTTSEEKTSQGHFESSGWHEPTMSEHRPTYSEHTETDWRKVEQEKMKRKVQKIDSKIVRRAEQFEKLLNKKPGKEDRFAKIIRERFNNPKSLKEYIIMSEIIGKPKAFYDNTKEI